jgi:hypothetical protein
MAKLMVYTSGPAAIESWGGQQGLSAISSEPAKSPQGFGSTTDPKQLATLGSGVLVGNGLMVLFSHTFWPFGELMSIPHPLSSLELYHAAVCGNHAKENLLDGNPSQQLEVAEHLAGAQHHAAQWVVSDAYRQPGFFPDSLVQVFQ